MSRELNKTKDIHTKGIAMKIFEVNDYEYWMAETAEQARQSCVDTYKSADMAWPVDKIRELSPDEMRRLKVFDDIANETRTLEEQLAKLLSTGVSGPEIFASTEY